MCVCVCGERDEGRELEEGSSRKGGKEAGKEEEKEEGRGEREGRERGSRGREGGERERKGGTVGDEVKICATVRVDLYS